MSRRELADLMEHYAIQSELDALNRQYFFEEEEEE
jgi:hypothetical protein